jgi:NADH-quinone oxidoreductase subunit K
MVPQSWYLLLSAALFGLGVLGFASRRNMLVMFMSIELMLNAANVAFVACAKGHEPARGTVYALFVIAVAAAEASVGLALVLALFRRKKTVDADAIRELRA